MICGGPQSGCGVVSHVPLLLLPRTLLQLPPKLCSRSCIPRLQLELVCDVTFLFDGIQPNGELSFRELGWFINCLDSLLYLLGQFYQKFYLYICKIIVCLLIAANSQF